MIKSDFKLEKKLSADGYGYIIGTDEAGRGPLCGPVVAAAAMYRDPAFSIPEEKMKAMNFVRDSKTLSGKKREELFDFINDNFYIGIGLCDHKTIDEINILEASFLAMKKALTDLNRVVDKKNSSRIILIDGNKAIPNLSLEQRSVVGGDKFVKSISAASIIAKVTRDRIMLEMHKKFPEYGFDKHKGYGTKLHMEMLEKYGPCKIHRQSFEPVKSLAKKQK